MNVGWINLESKGASVGPGGLAYSMSSETSYISLFQSSDFFPFSWSM